MLFLYLIFISIPVPATAQKTLEQIVARVNAEIILKSDYEAEQRAIREELSQSGMQGVQLDQAVQERSKHILRDLIDNSLLVQQAKEMGLSADLEVIKTEERMRQQHNQQNPTNQLTTIEDLEKAISQQMNLEDFKQRIRTQYLRSQVLNREVYGRVQQNITTEDLRKYYDEHKKDFDKPEGIHIREIVVNADPKIPSDSATKRKKIDDALAALKKGDDFGEVAQKYSESETAQSGGDLGFFEKGHLSKDLEELVSKLNKGQFSDVLQTSYGFMIIRVEDKHAGGVLPFESAQNDVYNVMFNERALPAIRDYLNKLREVGFVEVREGYVDTGAVTKNEH
jgi:peptidyl-prolyl cis-trans isomerase SurA